MNAAGSAYRERKEKEKRGKEEREKEGKGRKEGKGVDMDLIHLRSLVPARSAETGGEQEYRSNALLLTGAGRWDRSRL